jgi:hypothetical protein
MYQHTMVAEEQAKNSLGRLYQSSVVHAYGFD